MSLAYPLASSASDALTGAGLAARTRYEAEALAGTAQILALETEWIKPPSADLDALLKQAVSGEAKGFIQTYEDADGKPVLAVTYWKLAGTPTGQAAGPSQTPAAAEPAAPATPAPARQAPSEIDHTDDLYFREGRTRAARRRKTSGDPRQMDLFVSPDPRGYEHKDPNNPATMLTDEEGDGTTFGGASDDDADGSP